MFREIIIFVTGTTPQIITETLSVLARKSEEAVIPDELYIITTLHGKERIEEELVQKGRFNAFCEEYGLRPDLLNERSFILLREQDETLLKDIRTTSDNESAGDTIANFIREKSADMNTRIHCSIAGGRKTMSFYLGSALQLFGRPWDRLYHVLVTPEFESNPEFYYKPSKGREIAIRDKNGAITKRLNTEDAEIELAELPFIRLRDKLRLNGKTFSDLVLEGQREIDTAMTQPAVRVNLKDRIVTIGDKELEFKPLHLILYTYLLRQKIDNCCYPDRTYCMDCIDCFKLITDITGKRAMEAMLKDYEKTYGPASGQVERFKQTWKNGIDREKFRSDRSKINKDIHEALGNDTISTLYVITSTGKYGDTRYGVKVEKGKIGVE